MDVSGVVLAKQSIPVISREIPYFAETTDDTDAITIQRCGDIVTVLFDEIRMLERKIARYSKRKNASEYTRQLAVLNIELDRKSRAVTRYQSGVIYDPVEFAVVSQTVC